MNGVIAMKRSSLAIAITLAALPVAVIAGAAGAPGFSDFRLVGYGSGYGSGSGSGSCASLAPDAFVTNVSSATVTPINTGTRTAGPPIPVGLHPVGIAITPDGK